MPAVSNGTVRGWYRWANVRYGGLHRILPMVSRYLVALAVLFLLQVAPSHAQDQSFAAFTAEL